MADVGWLSGLFASGDDADRTEFYEIAGISGTYQPQLNHVS